MESSSREAPEVVVEFGGEEPEGLSALAAANPSEITVVRAKGFGAFDFTVQALVVIVPAIAIQLGAIVRTHLEANRYVRIKVDGREIEGVDPETALEILQRLQDGTGNRPDPD